MDFENLNIDPVDGAETMRLLGLGTNDLVDPLTFSKIKDVIDFFKGAVDKRHVLNMVTSHPFAKNVDRVNHVWNYVELKKVSIASRERLSKAKTEYDSLSSQMRGIDRELKLFEL